MKRCYAIGAMLARILILLVFAHHLYARDDFDFAETKEPAGFGLPVSGRISFEGARQLDNPERFIRLGPAAELVMDADTPIGQFYFEGLGRYNLSYRIENDPDLTRKDYETETILRELFWKNNMARFTLSFGKIINDFTVMDLLQVADKTSAVNRADYWFADPKEVKLGQNMLKLDYFASTETNAGFIAVPFPAFDRVTDQEHPYALVKNQELHETGDTPDMEGSLFVSTSFAKSQFTLFGGRFNNRMPILEARPGTNTMSLYKVYADYWSAGGTVSACHEPFLFKAELAYNFDRPLQARQNQLPAGFARKNEVEVALGADINLGDFGMASLECLAKIPDGGNERLAINRPAFFGAFTWSDTYRNDKLKLQFMTLCAESFINMINRCRVDYFLTNTLSVAAKYTRFDINEKKEDYGFMDHYSRVDLSFNYDFNLE